MHLETISVTWRRLQFREQPRQAVGRFWRDLRTIKWSIYIGPRLYQ